MKKQLLKKYFIIFCVAIIVPVVFSYYINYTYSYENLVESAIEERETMLAQTSRALDQIFARAEFVAPQILLNDSVRKIMNVKLAGGQSFVFDGDIELSQEYVMALSMNSNFVNEITLISFKNNILLDSGYFAIQQLDDSFYRLAKEFDLLESSSYWDFEGEAFRLLGMESSNKVYYTQVVYENFFDPVGMIIISLSDAGIVNIVDTILAEEDAFIFISDLDGNALINQSVITDNLDIDEYRMNLFEPSYVSSNDNLVIKNNYSNYGYVLNMVIPMKTISVDRRQMKLYLIIYMINFAVIVAACYLTAYSIASKFDKINKELDVNDEVFKFSTNEVERIKKHIKNMKTRISQEEIRLSNAADENSKLLRQISQNKGNLKRNISYSLLFGGQHRRNETVDKLGDFDIQRQGNYIVVLIGFNTYLDEITQLDEGLSINVKESMRKLFETGIINFAEVVDLFYSDSKDGEKLIAILNINEKRGYLNEISKKLGKFYDVIKHDLKIKVNISAGSLISDIIDIRRSYQEAYDYQKYQLVASGSPVLIKGIVREDSIVFSVEEYKKNLINILKANDVEKIKIFFDTFAEAVRTNPEFLSYCRDTLEEIINFAENYKDDFSDDYQDMKNALADFNHRFETGDRAIEYIKEKLQNILSNRSKGTLSQHSLVMINVIAYIHENYHKDISLSEIAERYNISYPYLSKLFKKEMGESFKTYLTKIKIEMSAKFLIRSDEPINSIAVKVGYNSLRQFYTMFKKCQGMTPAAYREKFMQP